MHYTNRCRVLSSESMSRSSSFQDFDPSLFMYFGVCLIYSHVFLKEFYANILLTPSYDIEKNREKKNFQS